MPGATRTLSYDGLQRPTRITSQAIGTGTHDNPAGAIIMEYRYAYDAAGNITERETEDGAYQYGYDLIDRLTQATPPPALQQDPLQPAPEKLPVEAYSYDPVHNRLTSQHQPGTWQYNADNQLLKYGIGPDQHSYTYNPNGHTATEITGDPATKTREFIYNAAERLTEIKDNGQPIGQYQYDPMGRRIRKHTSEGTTWFLYADEGLIAELDATGNATRIYGWKSNGLWGTDPLWLADRQNNAWQLHLYHNDHLWTPQRLTDIQGDVQWSGRSEAFGKTATITNLIGNPLRFPGQYFDLESLHYYNFFRSYSHDTSTYFQLDFMGLMAGVNSYGYSLGNPLARIDYLGLMACDTKISGSIKELKPSSDWIKNIHMKTVWMNLPDGGRAAVIGRYIVASSGKFDISILCERSIICCDTETRTSLQVSFSSPAFPAEYEYQETRGFIPFGMLPRIVKAAKVIDIIYDIAKSSPEFIEWYNAINPDVVCSKAMGGM